MIMSKHYIILNKNSPQPRENVVLIPFGKQVLPQTKHLQRTSLLLEILKESRKRRTDYHHPNSN